MTRLIRIAMGKRIEARCTSSGVPFVLAAALLFAGCSTPTMHGDRDLPNFQQVNASLYRGGQPTDAGLRRLREMGVKTVVNVRGSDDDRAASTTHSLEYEHRVMSAWRPSDEDVAWFLVLANDPRRQPVFVHCHHGSDRTGYLIAMYRVVIDGWNREAAIEEMTRHGNGFHDIYQGLITYVRTANVENIKTLMMEFQSEHAVRESDLDRTGVRMSSGR